MHKKPEGGRQNTMKCRKLIVAISLLMISVISIFAPRYLVRAESGINGNEAWVIAVVNGTFEYNGRYYRAYSGYIGQVCEYLNRDDVDLDEGQAANAVSYIYRHVADGIAEGYIYEIDIESGLPIEDVQTTEEVTETTTGLSTEITTLDNTTEATTEKAVVTEGLTNFEGTTDPDEFGTELPTDEHGAFIVPDPDKDIIKYDKVLDDASMEELAKYDKKKDDGIEDRPDEEKADAKVGYDESGDLYIETKDGSKKIDKLFPEWIKLSINIICISLFAVSVIMLIVSLFTKCIVINEKKHNKVRKGHSKRRKIRKCCRRVLTIALVCELLIPAIAGAVSFAMFRKGTIMQNLNKGGYFRYEYINYLADFVKDISAEKLETDSEDKVDVLSYEVFLFKAKNEISKTLSGGNAGDKILKVNAARNVYDIKHEFVIDLLPAIILTFVGAFISIITLYLVDGRRSRGVKCIAFSLALAGLLILITGIVLIFTKLHTKIYAEPDYLYSFIREVILSINRSVVLEGVFLLATGFIGLGLYRSIRKREE